MSEWQNKKNDEMRKYLGAQIYRDKKLHKHRARGLPDGTFIFMHIDYEVAYSDHYLPPLPPWMIVHIMPKK